MKKQSIAQLWIKFAAALNVRYPHEWDTSTQEGIRNLGCLNFFIKMLNLTEKW